MASVYDVTKYVLEELGEVTTMKLEKVVYYCQAWSLAWDGCPLFEEDFEAWANGPVCPELFKKHKGRFVVDKSLFSDLPDYNFSQSEKETICEVLKYYGDKNPQWLSELIHKELPWKQARGNTPLGMPCNTIILKEDMQQYYGGL